MDQTMTYAESNSDNEPNRQLNESFELLKGLQKPRKHPISPSKNSKFENLLRQKNLTQAITGQELKEELLNRNAIISPQNAKINKNGKLKGASGNNKFARFSEISGQLGKQSVLEKSSIENVKRERRSLRNGKFVGSSAMIKGYEFGSNPKISLGKQFDDFGGEKNTLEFDQSPIGKKSDGKKEKFGDALEKIEIGNLKDGNCCIFI